MTIHICENCGKEHDGSYGSGRFCCKHCRKVYIGKKSYETRLKNGTFKSGFSFSKKGKHKRSEYGTWKCEQCNLIFETRELLHKHNHECHMDHVCKFCKKECKSAQQLGGHTLHCKKNPDYEKNLMILREKTGWNKGQKHTEEEIKKIRISTVKYITDTLNAYPRISLKGCDYIDKLNELSGFNFQHGMNGGEVQIDGYFLDGYDKNNNIAFEYDERFHYVDLENNILREKDLKRMQYIHEKLDCRFLRYNEMTQELYEVKFN